MTGDSNNDPIYSYYVYLQVFIKKSKTDQFREGRNKTLARNNVNPELCPINVTVEYLRRLGNGYTGPLQPKLDSYGKPIGESIRYDLSLNNLKSLCAAAGTPTKQMTEHSYRRGGALKACESGLTHEEVQRHVGWKSADMVHRYTDQSTSRNIAISRRIMGKNGETQCEQEILGERQHMGPIFETTAVQSVAQRKILKTYKSGPLLKTLNKM